MIDMVLDLINRLIRRVGSQTLLSLLLLLVTVTLPRATNSNSKESSVCWSPWVAWP
jgi:hypothetical protein